MQTITFYSYKGGAGRSLALANAARYLARLGFKVVALDFDLEAPGLHYKFSSDSERRALAVQKGVIDYIHLFINHDPSPASMREFVVDVTVPGIDKPLIQLIPAGRVPSREYWSKLSRINWHELFYAPGARGVPIFLELKSRIQDELTPDFLLIDSRTGITEMGGVATTLLADKVVCFVLPTIENLEGARAVLRSLKHSKRESTSDDLQVLVALSRLPQIPEDERSLTDRILGVLNEEADDLKDTLSHTEIFILHAEAALEVREALRVGSGISPDDSVLLRDYLRLFANVVPRELIESRLGTLIELAKEKIWDDPEAALKEVEELAESFGHPEAYRALLRFYEVRNITGDPLLKRTQRLWELTRASNDQELWRPLRKAFKVVPRWQRSRTQWLPSLDFVEAVWREAGQKDSKFAVKLAEAYRADNKHSRAADLLIDIIREEPTGETVAQCLSDLRAADRTSEAEALISQMKSNFGSDPQFVMAWARHIVATNKKELALELLQLPMMDVLRREDAILAGQVYWRGGLPEHAVEIAHSAIREIGDMPEPRVVDLGVLFQELGEWETFEAQTAGRIPPYVVDELRNRWSSRRRRR